MPPKSEAPTEPFKRALAHACVGIGQGQTIRFDQEPMQTGHDQTGHIQTGLGEPESQDVFYERYKTQL